VGKPVSWYHEVFAEVFPNLDREAANTVWLKELKRSKAGKKAKIGEKETEEESGDED